MTNLLDASLEVSSQLIAQMSAAELEQEETLTGVLLGSLLASNALLIQLCSHLSRTQLPVWWSSYSKYRGSVPEHTEAGTGADFALLTFPGGNKARLALFQAKCGQAKGSERVFDVNRIPRSSKGSDAREAQMVVLADAARGMHDKAKPNARLDPDTDLSIKKSIDVGHATAYLKEIDWVHYLVYTDNGPKCMALKHLAQAFLQEKKRERKANVVKLGEKATWFVEVMRNATVLGTPYWLEFDEAAVAIEELPTLMSLMPVVVGDASGDFTVELEKIRDLETLHLTFEDSGAVKALARDLQQTAPSSTNESKIA